MMFFPVYPSRTSFASLEPTSKGIWISQGDKRLGADSTHMHILFTWKMAIKWRWYGVRLWGLPGAGFWFTLITGLQEANQVLPIWAYRRYLQRVYHSECDRCVCHFQMSSSSVRSLLFPYKHSKATHMKWCQTLLMLIYAIQSVISDSRNTFGSSLILHSSR